MGIVVSWFLSQCLLWLDDCYVFRQFYSHLVLFTWNMNSVSWDDSTINNTQYYEVLKCLCHLWKWQRQKIINEIHVLSSINLVETTHGPLLSAWCWTICLSSLLFFYKVILASSASPGFGLKLQSYLLQKLVLYQSGLGLWRVELFMYWW